MVRMWLPHVTVFLKRSHYQLGCSEHHTQREGQQAGLLGRCPTSRPLRQQPLCTGWLWGVPQRRNSRVPSGKGKDRDPLKWLQLCGWVTLSEPHPTSTQHIWTPRGSTPGSTVAPRAGRCNLRAAVAACQTTDGVFPLVQTGSRRDPSSPGVKYVSKNSDNWISVLWRPDGFETP